MKLRCHYCTAGRIAVDPGSSLTYPCPDCRRIDYDAAAETYQQPDPRDCDDRDYVETENIKEQQHD